MRIVIVDEYVLVRKGMATLVNQEPEVEVVGEASTIAEALRVIKSVIPDLVLMDIYVKKECSLDMIKKLKSDGLDCKFIILTSNASAVEFMDVLHSNTDGYLQKAALPEEILHAVRQVGRGKRYFDPVVLDYFMKGNKSSDIQELTPREMEVLIALGKGFNNRLIAKNLYITEYTVKKHISRILFKLNLRDRTQAALYANSTGLTKYR